MVIRPLIRFYILMISLLTSGTIGIYAQNQTIVSGRVLTDGRQVEYATIAVYRISDTNKIINATITDSLGRFSFSGLASNSYVIKISLQGYLPQKQLFSVDSANTNV